MLQEKYTIVDRNVARILGVGWVLVQCEVKMNNIQFFYKRNTQCSKQNH